jgi:cellulose synthase/poly-beta-1,6-N-acetylglucosamine synthase-like glycosyltransferase
MSGVDPDLSIVIPAYNEEMRLPATLERLAEYLPTLGLQTEVLRGRLRRKSLDFGCFRMERIAEKAIVCGTGCWKLQANWCCSRTRIFPRR